MNIQFSHTDLIVRPNRRLKIIIIIINWQRVWAVGKKD